MPTRHLLLKIILPLAIASVVLSLASILLVLDYAAQRQQTACTQEAKQCPDGSYVGRTGQDCRFAPCPSGPTVPPTVLDCNCPGDRCPGGYTCIQKCGPPVVRNDEPPPGYYCELDAVASQPRNCPICLASDVKISTPDGEVNVTDVKVGMRVWSVGGYGEKIPSTVLSVSQTTVPASHKIVHLVLADGREVSVSPGHPMVDGAPIGSLQAGDAFDGSSVVSMELLPYADAFTYDILPDGPTGQYWANGVRLGSTLFTAH